MYSPSELYERIVAIRRREECDAEEACRLLYNELKFREHPVLRESGEFMLRQIERRYFKMYGYSGGQAASGAQPSIAPATPNGDGHSPTDTQPDGAGAEPLEREGGQRPGDTQRSSAVPSASTTNNASGDAGGHPGSDTQRSSASGTPWPLRAGVSWDWNQEVPLMGGGRKRLGDITRDDLLRDAGIRKRTAETILEGAEARERLAELMEPGETLYEAWERQPEGAAKLAIKKLIGKS